MTNNELKDILCDEIMDEDVLDEMIVLEGDEFADGCIGYTDDFHLVYSYERLVESLGKAYGSEEDAIEWLEYNTYRAIPYMAHDGIEPIIIHEFMRQVVYMKISIESFDGYTHKERLISTPGYYLDAEIQYYPKSKIVYEVFVRKDNYSFHDCIGRRTESLKEALSWINKEE